MTLETSRRFWDEKARENAYWYISSARPYADRDLTEFWQSGTVIWRQLKQATRYTPRADHVVAEIGCGIGRLTRAIASDVGHVHAFDISEEMLQRARASAPRNATFHLTDGASLRPLADASVDCVVAYCVFQHLPSLDVLKAYLDEMRRVARPGGSLLFTLTPRDWTDEVLALSRAWMWLREKLRASGPRGLHRREWLGIRPRLATVRRVAGMPLAHTVLHGDKWLFWGGPGLRGAPAPSS